MPRLNGIPGEITPKKFQIGDQFVELYQIGDLAKSLGKQSNTVRKWETEGYLPAADYRSPRGLRLYTREQIEGLQELLIKHKIRKGVHFLDTKFKEEAKKLFATAQEETQNEEASAGGQGSGLGEGDGALRNGPGDKQELPVVEREMRDGDEAGETDSGASIPESADGSGNETDGGSEGEPGGDGETDRDGEEKPA